MTVIIISNPKKWVFFEILTKINLNAQGVFSPIRLMLPHPCYFISRKIIQHHPIAHVRYGEEWLKPLLYF
jgi:hypothetical protein